MRLILTSDDGTVLDSVEFTREDWDNLTPAGAADLLADLSAGAP